MKIVYLFIVYDFVNQASKLLNEVVDHCDPNEAVHARLQVATIKLQVSISSTFHDFS